MTDRAARSPALWKAASALAVFGCLPLGVMGQALWAQTARVEAALAQTAAQLEAGAARPSAPAPGGASGASAAPATPLAPPTTANTASPASPTSPAPAPALAPGDITLPQAQAMAVTALRRRQPVLAYRLAEGLLQADRQSSFAHFTLAQAHKQMGAPAKGRRAAARAYRFADKRLHRFEAARLAAGLAYAEDRKTLAQLWVRRAAQNAPNDATEKQLARDYARIRAENPLYFSIQGGLRPSSNVNNGSETSVQVIDGLPFTGTLSGSAQALSGMVGHLDGRLGYRIAQDKTRRTSVEGRLYLRQVALSGDARRQAPEVENSDLASTYAELGLRHEVVLGDGGATAEIGTALGHLWSGGAANYTLGRVQARLSWPLGRATRLTLGGVVEQRASARDSYFDSSVLAVQAGLRHRLAAGDTLSLALNLRDTDSDFFNYRNTSATLRASYAFAQSWGPAQVSAGITAGMADYPDFALIFAVPGGRQDRSLHADVSLFFPDMDYAGFAPTLRVSAGKTRSNVSRYETRELSVALGVRSKF